MEEELLIIHQYFAFDYVQIWWNRESRIGVRMLFDFTISVKEEKRYNGKNFDPYEIQKGTKKKIS